MGQIDSRGWQGIIIKLQHEMQGEAEGESEGGAGKRIFRPLHALRST
jgi:hypothetical protein